MTMAMDGNSWIYCVGILLSKLDNLVGVVVFGTGGRGDGRSLLSLMSLSSFPFLPRLPLRFLRFSHSLSFLPSSRFPALDFEFCTPPSPSLFLCANRTSSEARGCAAQNIVSPFRVRYNSGIGEVAP